MFKTLIAPMVGCIILAPWALSHAQITVYDDFSTLHLLPHLWKWHDNLSSSLEVHRIIVGGQLFLGLTTFAFQGNAGAQQGYAGVSLRESDAVKQMEISVTVIGAGLEDCPFNVLIPTGLAEFGGGFFNDGSSTTAGDMTGDIRAYLAWEAEFPDVSSGNIVGTVARCLNSSCSQQKTLRQIIFSGRWAKGVAQRGSIQWRPATKWHGARLRRQARLRPPPPGH